ncbi:MAG: membrane protein insertase YidC [Bacteroidales bacterium]
MNKNTVIGLLLIFGLMIGYSLWFAPEPPEPQPEKSTTASHADTTSIAADTMPQQKMDSAATKPASSSESEQTRKSSKPENAVLKASKGSFSHAAEGEDEFLTVSNDLLQVKIAKHGGRIAQVRLKKYETYDSLPVYLFTPDSSGFSFEFYNDNDQVITTGDYYFEPFWYGQSEASKMTVSGDDSLVFGMRLYAFNPDSVDYDPPYIEYQYTFKGNQYLIDMDVNFHQMSSVSRPVYSGVLNLTWEMDLRQQEKSQKSVMGGGSTIFFRDNVGDLDELNERDDEEEKISTGLEWIAFKQRFFNSMLWAKNESIDGAQLKTETKVEEPDPELHYLRTMSAHIQVPYDISRQDYTAEFAFYFGPNEYQRLKKYNIDMEQMIPLGWGFFLLHWINRFAVIPVFNYLEGFNLGYGIIILILTLLLKLILFPIAYKTYKSSARMRVLKPEVEEINKKYPKKDDAMKKQQATMALYKKAGVNPVAGCLPMLLQLPILIAMFRFFPSSIELRGQGFLWANDLSTYDSIATLPFEIPFYGDHVSLFTLLMAISTVLYTWVNNQNMNTGQQMPGMKTMLYFMPVMLLFIFNSYASGLSYYYFLANIITFIQMIVIRKYIDEDAIRAKIQQNKKKPVKKSKFQQRLEEAQKQQKKKKR